VEPRQAGPALVDAELVFELQLPTVQSAPAIGAGLDGLPGVVLHVPGDFVVARLALLLGDEIADAVPLFVFDHDRHGGVVGEGELHLREVLVPCAITLSALATGRGQRGNDADDHSENGQYADSVHHLIFLSCRT